MLLKLGSKGPMVKHRQQQLKRLGYYHGKLDGIFGPGTRQAVIKFQASRGLTADGIIGPNTAAALDKATGRHHGMLLRVGSRGEMVSMVQHKLHMLGYYHGKVDGIFGPMTEAAVKAFQTDHGLSPDGIVGPMTHRALMEAMPGKQPQKVLRLGSTGPHVAMCQEKLKMLGYYTGRVDGIFGPLTEAAVKAFQADYGLTPDGVVGPMTHKALMEAVPGKHAPKAPGMGVSLQLGSTGDLVAVIQHKLQMLGYYQGMIDSIFGPKTEEAVKAFQSAKGLVVDGIVGPKTLMAIKQA